MSGCNMDTSIKSILAGLTLLLVAGPVYSATQFYDNFESGDLSHTESGFGWNGTSSGPAPDGKPVVSTDIARSGSHSVKFTFGAGGAGDDAWSELRYILGRNMTDVYIQWYQYFPNGTEGLGPKWVHRQDYPDNNKFLKLWADSYTSYTVTTGVSTRSKSNGDSVIYTDYGTNQTGGVGQFGAAQDSVGIDDSRRGRWVKFQWHIKAATSANNDGVIQMWVDDQLVLSNTNLPLYPSGGVGNYFRNGYIMGWANSGFSQTSVTYIDDVTISDTYIGGNPLMPPVAQ